MFVVIGIAIGVVARSEPCLPLALRADRFASRRRPAHAPAAPQRGEDGCRDAPARGADRGPRRGRPAARDDRGGGRRPPLGDVKIEERVLAKEDEIDGKLTELARREQGIADREVHRKQLQEELKDDAREELVELERISGMTVQRGEDASARALGGARPARARAPRPAGRGGGAQRGEAAGAQPRRRRAPARGREPRRRDDGLAGRAPVRRHEGPHHRPRGAQHPRARAPDRRRRDHRRHAAGGRALVASTASAARWRS